MAGEAAMRRLCLGSVGVAEEGNLSSDLNEKRLGFGMIVVKGGGGGARRCMSVRE